MSQANVVYFDPSINGLGDCIIGLASAWVLAQVLQAEFRVLNGFLDPYFAIPPSYRAPGVGPGTIIWKHEYWARDPAEQWRAKVAQWQGRSLVVQAYSNFSRFLYRIPEFAARVPVPETEVFMRLFRDVLLPHPTHAERFARLSEELKLEQALCVHVRCDDVWGDSNTGERRFDVDGTIRRFARCVRSLTRGEMPVVLISDHPDRVLSLFAEEGITCSMIPGQVAHSGKSTSVDHEKTMMDLWTIGACREAVLSYWSNFSRIGALRAGERRPWIVEPVVRGWDGPFDFNVRVGRDVEWRQADLAELLSKEA
jgi:hypothetical protein